MSAIAELLGRGVRPVGTHVTQLAGALLAAARWDVDYNVEQRAGMIALLLPTTAAENEVLARQLYLDLVFRVSRARDCDGINEGEAVLLALNTAYYEVVHASPSTADSVEVFGLGASASEPTQPERTHHHGA